MKYEVTIGIPVYNVKEHIRQTLDSAMAQTFPSIEYLICDDCGTDGSMDVVHEYQQSHPRGKDIRIVRQPHNMGIGNARNRLIGEAQGKYLFFLDADDTISSNAIELLNRTAMEYNAEFVYASYERIEVFDENQKQSIACCYPLLYFSEKNEFANYVYLKYDNIQAPVWNILMSLEVLRKNNIRFEPVNYWEDFAVSIDLPTYVTRVVLLPNVTYHYYCRGGSLSHFQERTIIYKNEIEQTINLINQLKWNVNRIKNEDYFPMRMYKVMMTEFYIVCTILRNEHIISPSFTNDEIRDIIKSPMTLNEILHFRQARLPNLLLFVLSKLTPMVSVFVMRVIGKIRGLI